jgi:hypothetical protein
MPANRLHSLVLLLALMILCLLPPTSQGYAHATAWKSSAGQMVQSMLDQVNTADVRTLTGNLSGAWEVLIGDQPYTIETRHALSGTPAAKAAQYLFEFYEGLGLDVEDDQFTFKNRVLSNIVAEKEGSVFPERIFMITSHYDDLPASGPAPGADDNASGTIAVMMAAEILSQYDFGCTLRFINFGAEEFGMIGSQDYARQAYCAGEDIRGVINTDMIAWNSPGSSNGMDLHALPAVAGSDELAVLFQEVVSDYSLDLIPELSETITTRSDHASFWKYGYPAILVSEDWEDFNTNYHTAGDDLDSLQDFEYYASMIKASLGTLAHAGCLVDTGWGSVSGKVVDSQTRIPISDVPVQLNNPEWGYSWSTRSDENGDYQFSALAGWHKLSVDDFGYARQEAKIQILQNETRVKDFELEAVEEQALFLPLAANINNTPPADCP